MLIAALLIVAKTWKHPKFPSIDEWLKKTWYVCMYVCVCVCVCVYIYIYIKSHTMEYYSAIKKNEILPFCSNMGEPDRKSVV